MSISKRVFQDLADWAKGQKEMPPCTQDPTMLKAYILLLLATTCNNSKLETMYRVLWSSYRRILYTYEDELDILRDSVYDYAVEGEDVEAEKVKDTLETLEHDHSSLKALFARFNQIGIYHY
jgi:hypothetical protein